MGLRRYMIRDRDHIYGAVVTRRLRAMGIRTSLPHQPHPAECFAERLIRIDPAVSVWTTSLSWARSFGRPNPADLMRTITTASESSILEQGCAGHPPIQRIGSIKSHAILGGLHHHYAELKFRYTHGGNQENSFMSSASQNRTHRTGTAGSAVTKPLRVRRRHAATIRALIVANEYRNRRRAN